MEGFENLDMSAFMSIDDMKAQQEEVEKTTEPKKEEPKQEVPVEEEEKVVEENKNQDAGEDEDGPEGVASEDEEDADEASSSTSPYSSLAKALAEEGVLPSLDEETKIESVDDLIEAFRTEIKNNEFSDLNEEQKEYLKAIRNGVPLDAYKETTQASQQLGSITSEEIESNEDLRRELIYQNFIAEGLSKEKAEKLTKRSFDIGEDVADATESLDGLKAYQQKVQQEQIQAAEQNKKELEKQNQEQLKSLQKNINELKELIPGVKVSDKIKEKVFDQATKPVAQLDNGQYVNAIVKARMEDPVGFETKLNYLFYVTKGFSDFSKVSSSQKTNAVKELENHIKGNTFIPSGQAATENLDYSPDLDGFDPNIINNIK